VAAKDKSIVALLGASPGASTAASISIDVLKKCFGNELTEGAWLPRLKAIIPTYGIDLKTDADACRRARAETAQVLNINDISASSGSAASAGSRERSCPSVALRSNPRRDPWSR
jgi:malate dehydrogenase (quinone)